MDKVLWVFEYSGADACRQERPVGNAGERVAVQHHILPLVQAPVDVFRTLPAGVRACVRVYECWHACVVAAVVPASECVAEERIMPTQASSTVQKSNVRNLSPVPVCGEQRVQSARIQVEALSFCTQVVIQHATSARVPPRKANPTYVAPSHLRVRGRGERTSLARGSAAVSARATHARLPHLERSSEHLYLRALSRAVEPFKEDEQPPRAPAAPLPLPLSAGKQQLCAKQGDGGLGQISNALLQRGTLAGPHIRGVISLFANQRRQLALQLLQVFL
jgi:hypothetical protein